MNAEILAQMFHESYERLAPEHGYDTREASAVPWEEVPEANKNLMIAVCGEILAKLDIPEKEDRMTTSECHAILEEAKKFASGEFSRTSIAKCEDMLEKVTAAEKAIGSGEVILDAHNQRVFQINFAMAKSTAESILETADLHEEREA